VDYVLPANVERIRIHGTAGAVKIGGNALNNVLVGNDYDNRLDGGAGADSLSGMGGADTYIVDDAGTSFTRHPSTRTATRC
jgi:Ca2+-binding RTX toxin-like protein